MFGITDGIDAVCEDGKLTDGTDGREVLEGLETDCRDMLVGRDKEDGVRIELAGVTGSDIPPGDAEGSVKEAALLHAEFDITLSVGLDGAGALMLLEMLVEVAVAEVPPVTTATHTRLYAPASSTG